MIYRTAELKKIEPSDRCPFCENFTLIEDESFSARQPVLWCVWCEQVAAIGTAESLRKEMPVKRQD